MQQFDYLCTYFQATVLHESFASNVSCTQFLSLPSRVSYQHIVSTDWSILVGQRFKALFVQRPTTAQSTSLVDSPFSNDFFRPIRQLLPHHRTCETKSLNWKFVLVASLQICILVSSTFHVHRLCKHLYAFLAILHHLPEERTLSRFLKPALQFLSGLRTPALEFKVTS